MQPVTQHPAIRELAEQGDWAGLVRWWLTDWDRGALEAAAAIAKSTGPEIAVYLGQIAVGSWPILDERLFDRCTDNEARTLALLALEPIAVAFMHVRSAHLSEKSTMIRQSVDASQRALSLAQDLHDPHLQKKYHGYIAGALCASAKPQDALSHIDITIDLARRFYRDDPQRFSADLAYDLTNAGRVNEQLGRSKDAILYYLEAAQLYMDYDAGIHNDAEAADVFRTAGRLQYLQNDFEGALQSFATASTLYRNLARTEVSHRHTNFAAALYDVAVTQHRLGLFGGSVVHFEECLRTLRSIDAPQQQSENVLAEIAKALNALGVVQRDMGKLSDALSTLREALTIRQHLADIDPDRHNPDVAMTLRNVYELEFTIDQESADTQVLLDMLAVDQGAIPLLPRYSAAPVPVWISMLRRFFVFHGVADLESAREFADDPDVKDVLQPELLFGLGNVNKVERIVTRFRLENRLPECAAAGCLLVLPDLKRMEISPAVTIRHNNIIQVSLLCEAVGFFDCAAFIYYQLGKYYDLRGELRPAATLIDRAITMIMQARRDIAEDYYIGLLARILNSRGIIAASLRDFSGAEGFLIRSIELNRKAHQRLYLANAIFNLANVYLNAGKTDLCKMACAESFDVYNEHRDSLAWQTIAPLAAKCLLLLVDVTENVDQALALCDDGISLLRQGPETVVQGLLAAAEGAPSQGWSGPDMLLAMSKRAALLARSGRHAEAGDAFEECVVAYNGMPAPVQAAVKQNYAILLSKYASMMSDYGDAARALDIHKQAVLFVEKPIEQPWVYLYKGSIPNSYRALLEECAKQGDTSKVFRCLAAMRESRISALLNESHDILVDAACMNLRTAELSLNRRIRIVVAEMLSSEKLLLGVFQGGPNGFAFQVEQGLLLVADKLFHMIQDAAYDRGHRCSLRRIEALGRQAWAALPAFVQNALAPEDDTDVLISGDSYWMAFPWEALRVCHEGAELWLGELRALSRWSPLSEGAMETLRPKAIGKGHRVGAVICPWDAIRDRLLPSAQTECEAVSLAFERFNYRLLDGMPLSGTAANKRAVLQALFTEPEIVHFAGHGEMQGPDEVLVVSHSTRTGYAALGKTDILQYKNELGITGRAFKQAPLIFLNACFAGSSRTFGGKREDLMAFLIEEGAVAVIGSPHPIHDRFGELWATTFYERMFMSYNNFVADVFLRCRSDVRRTCLESYPDLETLWMLIHLHGNPYATIFQ